MGLEGTIVVVLGAASPGEMKYRENYLKIIMEKYSGMLIPDLNSPEVLGEVFESMVFGFGTVRYTTRLATDFFISPTSEGAQGFIKTVNKEARKLLEEYWKKETVIPGCQYLFNTPHKHYSAGAHVENLYLYDPFDPESLEATRELVGRTLDPHGKFRNFGAPCLGGGLQYEPVQHVSQNWGPVYENYDLWLRKIKTALDPNNVADWGAYVPTEYPEEKE